MTRSLSVALSLLAFAPAVSRAADISALLLRQTQAFSDAGKNGDAKTMDRLLDPGVVFVNEDGDVASKQDLLDSAGPPPRDVHFSMKVMDWNCVVHGHTAVAKFIDAQTGTAYGQPVHAAFRSVEAWLEQDGAWRMIASQTLAVQEDPPAVALPAATLDQYVGTYQAAPQLRVILSRGGDSLMASTNGGPAAALKAELRDVFFTPGHPRVRKIFSRDEQGMVTGFVSRHEGHDIVFRRA